MDWVSQGLPRGWQLHSTIGPSTVVVASPCRSAYVTINFDDRNFCLGASYSLGRARLANSNPNQIPMKPKSLVVFMGSDWRVALLRLAVRDLAYHLKLLRAKK